MSKIKILLVDEDGSMTLSTIEPDLPTLQGLVGGYIEGVSLPLGAFGYVNEEGLIKGMPDNLVASALAKTTIVGPMVVVGMRGSDEADVPVAFLDYLEAEGFTIGEVE